MSSGKKCFWELFCFTVVLGIEPGLSTFLSAVPLELCLQPILFFIISFLKEDLVTTVCLGWPGNCNPSAFAS
jgi:hypothetical protein